MVRGGDGEELGKGEWRELREGPGGDGEEKHELRGGEAGKHQEGGDEGINHVTTLGHAHSTLCWTTRSTAVSPHTQSHDLDGF